MVLVTINWVGDDGDDILAGGLGRDRLIGGKGADTFIFDTFEQRTDFIADFSHAQKDKNSKYQPRRSVEICSQDYWTTVNSFWVLQPPLPIPDLFSISPKVHSTMTQMEREPLKQ